jgi:hypothetical protein
MGIFAAVARPIRINLDQAMPSAARSVLIA